MTTPTTPIAVTDTPTQAANATTLRDLFLSLAVVATALGWAGVSGKLTILAGVSAAIIAVIGTGGALAMTAYRWLHSKLKQTQLAVAAHSADDSVAVVAPKVVAAINK